MTQAFRSFVIFAEMRTGSNLLEATLNAIKRVTCYGEAFNPYMMGWPDKDELRGITMAERDADPLALFDAIRSHPNLTGFRYFHDHDPRVLDAIMDDHSCAKVVLARNPLDSYVSTRLAYATNQWKLNETETPIPARIRFDAAEFGQMMSEIEQFQLNILHRLQVSGQSAFWLGYEDLRDNGVMTGLLHWLGRTDLERVEPASDQVPQNPRELADKVENFDEMQGALAAMDPFQSRRLPSFEPRRGPAVPSFMAADAGKGLVFMPVKGGPSEVVASWLRGLGAVTADFNQNSLRQWKRQRPGHRGFTVVRHPLLRAWAAFAALANGGNAELRELLRTTHRVPLPEGGLDAVDDPPRVFAAFLDFLRRNLNGQTTLATHPGWATQAEVVSGFARFVAPDLIAREDRLNDDLAFLTRAAEIDAAPPKPDPIPALLDDAALRKAAKAAYLRDYVTFGFADRP